ncbi:MAG: mechanosensitive ion channel family protein [Treponema sp.]|jgi:small-conductance mechanosensitive channel|nr:mechanosensitive ion channel family protein [Treponema sp.]
MNTGLIVQGFKQFINGANPAELLAKLVGMILTVIFILAVFNLIQYFLGKFLKGKLSVQRDYMVRKGIRYSGFVLALLYVFHSMGIDTSAILGAAGIAGIVIGFAAQTSVASLIAGFFLLSEKSFTVGDTITVDSITGVVLSVDLLSVKLRTPDNLFVRIPNETISKSSLVTITRFPIRRLNLAFSVAYKEDLEQVRDILLELAAQSQYCLEDPPPFFGIDSFGDSGINLLFHLWFEKNNFWNLKNSIIIAVKKRFEAEGIEIPYQKIDIQVTPSG